MDKNTNFEQLYYYTLAKYCKVIVQLEKMVEQSKKVMLDIEDRYLKNGGEDVEGFSESSE